MKLHFPHGDHADVELVTGHYTIGGSADADIRLEDKGLSDIHAKLTILDNECEVSIDNAARLISVNGKLVKDKKEVREGDLMIAAQVHIKLLSSVVEEEEDDNRTRVRMALPKFILRGVSGAYFGKTYPLRGSTIIGRHSECHICVNADGISRKHVQIDADPNGLKVKDLGSSNGTFVNGKKVDECEIKVGDELKIDNIRFLVQTPGMTDPTTDANAKKANATTKKHQRSQDDPIEKSSGGVVKWLVTLVVLGGAIGAAWKMGYLNGILG
ncbi:FHA domain-containing protein [Marinicella litoralis]|uniref:Type III secretion system (T3SS) inner membrane Yop/YscD-like protein n=1 Tax=Marinicella litoralis TaxID=644220 RepID=A0A4R6XLP0_9GAMM|nr:FHA domain-containing protein [Marinicella litoralis]TDR18517.1 type III secretion system (T3SS) inner membrane Yop/YscD-like protein [Marinicella litoralis]